MTLTRLAFLLLLAIICGGGWLIWLAVPRVPTYEPVTIPSFVFVVQQHVLCHSETALSVTCTLKPTFTGDQIVVLFYSDGYGADMSLLEIGQAVVPK